MKRTLCLLLICCFLTACSQPAASAADTATETVAQTAAGVIMPLPVTVDVNALDNCTVAVSLEEGDAYVDDTGYMQMDVTVYGYDLYDMVDISLLKEGDVIFIRGNAVTVASLERSDRGDVLINGGLDLGGHELRTDDSTVFYEYGYSDMKYWYPLGTATVPVSPDFIYTDSSDLDSEPQIRYAGDFLIPEGNIDYRFQPADTTLVIENGMAIAMYRVYTP